MKRQFGNSMRCLFLPIALFGGVGAAMAELTPETILAGKASRIPASLREIHHAFIAAGRQPQLEAPASAAGALTYQIRDGAVRIEAVSDDPVALKADLVRLGLRDAQRFALVVSGWLPIERIPELQALDSVRVLRPVIRFQPAPPSTPAFDTQRDTDATPPGEVGDQGDLSMGTNLLRARYGIDGTGVTVGVISDRFDATGGAAEDVAAGRLPGGILAVNDETDGIDEGRAMMQLIHKIAPGARLAFSALSNSEAETALRVLELAGCPPTIPADVVDDCEPISGEGARVIVDDIDLGASEPFFQIGLWSQAVNMVRDAGVSYLTSAGNAGDDSYESWFRPSGVPGYAGGVLHDFDPSPAVDVYQRLYIPVGAGLPFNLQWSDVFASACREPCGGARSDFDIALVGDGEGKSIVLAGSFENNIGGDPHELFGWGNDGTIDIDGIPGPDEHFNLTISHVSGAPDHLIKYIVRRLGSSKILEYRTDSSTTYGHESADGAMSVGAVNWPETPYFGRFPALATSYSALGGTPILFDALGRRTFVVPQQPWILGPDAVQVWVAGSPDHFQGPFNGTSAAAPSAAAAAALLLSYKPDLSPEAIKYAFAITALPWRTTPAYDFKNGFGWIDPLGAADWQFVAPDDVLIDVVANGKRDRLTAGASPVSISARLEIGEQMLGQAVDLFLGLKVEGQWYSLVVGPDGQAYWVHTGGSEADLMPYLTQFVLSQLQLTGPDILRLQQALPGSYEILVGLDRMPNGRLDADTYVSSRVTVEMGLPLVP